MAFAHFAGLCYQLSALLTILLFLVSLHLSICTPSSSSSTATTSSSSTATMSPSELEALYQVMEAIAGDRNWRMQHPAPCTGNAWPGVVCEQVKQKYGGEDYDDGNDNGSVLVHVTRLDLGYKPNPICMPNATLPSSIGNLPFLQSLFIVECFTEANTTIPPEIGRLASSLNELSLRSNAALVGEIPSEMGALTSLQVLSLSQNSLSGSIPAAIGKLQSLEHLDLSDNMLSGAVPQEIGGLSNLVILDLSMNELEGGIPASMGKLTMVQKMDLSYNGLEGRVPMEIGNLINLQFLSMSGNALRGPLPLSLANLSTNLQYLILHNNPINEPIPSFLGQFSSIMALSLSNSGYFGHIPESLGNLANLSVLSLDRNNLSGPIPQCLAELPHIYSLNLSQNCLSGPVPFTPAFVSRLGRNLDLQGNSGLCSHWAFPQNSTTGQVMRLCSDLNYINGSSYSSSASSSHKATSSTHTPLLVILLAILLSTYSSFGYTLEEVAGNIFPYWTRSIARWFWEVHGRDGQSSELQHHLDYSGMHQVIDEEDSDDTVEDLDGAVDYLSDRREEEEVEELDVFLRVVAVAVIQHAIMTRRRLVFDPLGSVHAGSQIKPGKGTFLLQDVFGTQVIKLVNGFRLKKFYGKVLEDPKWMVNRAEEIGSKRVTVSVLGVAVEFFGMALVEFSHGIGIQNSSNGLAVGVWIAESKIQTEECWANGMGKKCLGILSSVDNYFQDIIAPSADVINERTRHEVNFAWHARFGGEASSGHARVCVRANDTYSVYEGGDGGTASIAAARRTVEVESDVSHSKSYQGSGDTAVAAFDPNKEET
ncbi:hypothetical protein L7F22_007470 [Adiantum nelumboides]|nr:hypothetical protein [Adiantum nelumboides]